MFLKQNLHCASQVVKRQKTFVPLEPQPDPSDVVTMHRYYIVLKRQTDFEKRTYWFSCDAKPELLNIALVEYNGILKDHDDCHGNSKHRFEPYRRTNPYIMEKAVIELQNKKPGQVYQEMVFENSFDAPKDFQQLRDLKCRNHAKKKDKPSATI